MTGAGETGGSLRLALIAGYGRSGSTLLDRVLGHHQDIFAVGELVNVHRELWLSNHYCGCGERGRDCLFWEDVRRRWLAGRGDDAIERFLALRGRAIGRVGLQRGGLSQAERGVLVHENADLYRSIAAASGKAIIFDSSKSPGWVDLNLRVPRASAAMIHLVRDGRDVVASLRRPLSVDVAAGVQHDISRRSALHSSLAWLVGNAAAERVARRPGVRSIRLAYEQLLLEPGAALRAVGLLLGVDLSEEAQMIEEGRPFPRTHAVAGGRVRMSESVVVDRRLRPAQLAPLDAAAFWLTAGGLAYRYGYRPGLGRARTTGGR